MCLYVYLLLIFYILSIFFIIFWGELLKEMVKSIPLLRKDAICANMEIEYRTGKNGNNLLRENFSIELKTIIVNCKSLSILRYGCLNQGM